MSKVMAKKEGLCPENSCEEDRESPLTRVTDTHQDVQKTQVKDAENCLSVERYSQNSTHKVNAVLLGFFCVLIFL